MGVDTELEELLAYADRGMAVAWHARRRPATPALITTAGTITYNELNERANRLARAFRRRGLRRGDAVALLCSNRAEFVEVLLATQRSGAIRPAVSQPRASAVAILPAPRKPQAIPPLTPAPAAMPYAPSPVEFGII